jgi:hypothetical protein
MEYGHFFANPVVITSKGPQIIHEIMEAHRSVCTQISDVFNQSESVVLKTLNICNPQYFSTKYFSVLLLYHAIVMVLNRIDRLDQPPGQPISLYELAKRQTVLAIRTGTEDQLSAPISFECLKADSFPLGRTDIPENLEVVRVLLAVAIKVHRQFETREESADDRAAVKRHTRAGTAICPGNLPEGAEVDACLAPKTFADALIAKADRCGYDHVQETREFIRQI